MDDLIELIEHAWNTNTKEAEQVLQQFIHIFGMEGAENHLNSNAPICAASGISPHNYLELCGAIKRTMNISDISCIYFRVGIRNLIMATNEA